MSAGDLRPEARPDREGLFSASALERWATRVTGSAHRPGPARRVHWLRQVHGERVVTVGKPGVPPGPGAVIAVAAGTGDALVSGAGTAALCVLTADCASVALGSDEGVFGAVHGGWRGLVGGVVEATAAAMRDLGASRVVGALGPCIHRGCYEFSEPELDAVAARYGATVRGRTLGGRPALDLPATVSAALAAAGVEEATGVDACTACAGRYFSHRARGDQGRQALLVWSGGGSDPR